MSNKEAVSAATDQSILTARAKVLAQPNKPELPIDTLEAVIFRLAYETYAIETLYVSEVYPLKELTPLPGTPAFVAGIVNMRGQVRSVIDVKKFFGLPTKGLTDLNKIILLSDGNMEFGILADAILEVANFSAAEIQPALPTLTGIRAHYLRGITAQGLVVLDAAALLSDKSIIVNQTVE